MIKLFIILILTIFLADRAVHPISVLSGYASAIHTPEKTTEVFMAKMPINKLLNKKFEKLTILKEVDPIIYNYTHRKNDIRRRVLCLCDCGKEKIIFLSNIMQGKTKSCGCLTIKSATKHGYYKDKKPLPTLSTWLSMIQRCTNKNHRAYKDYGGRGIKVCDRWLKSFENFLEDMGERPENTEIDRDNNDGNYEPSNCKWVTAKNNSRNRRSTKLSLEDAWDIRNAYALGCFTKTEIADGYNVSRGIITQIILNKCWT